MLGCICECRVMALWRHGYLVILWGWSWLSESCDITLYREGAVKGCGVVCSRGLCYGVQPWALLYVWA